MGKGPDQTPYGTFSEKQYGFRLGGPVVKDKLFFFVSGEMGDRASPTNFIIDDSGASNDFGGELFEELHEGLANAMLAVVAVHVAGVLASSLLHGENLAKSMLTGYKRGEPVLGIRRAHWLMGFGVLAGVLGFWVRFA